MGQTFRTLGSWANVAGTATGRGVREPTSFGIVDPRAALQLERLVLARWRSAVLILTVWNDEEFENLMECPCLSARRNRGRGIECQQKLPEYTACTLKDVVEILGEMEMAVSSVSHKTPEYFHAPVRPESPPARRVNEACWTAARL